MKKTLLALMALGLIALAGCDFFAPPETFMVSYDANGGSGTAPTDSKDYEDGDKATVAAVGSLTKTENTFAGWNTKADGTGTSYAAAAKIDMGNDVTLYAQWTDLLLGTWKKITVDFGGFSIDFVDVFTVTSTGYVINRSVYATGLTYATATLIPVASLGALGMTANPQDIETGTYSRAATSSALKTTYTGYFTCTKVPPTVLYPVIWYNTKFSTVGSVANDTLTLDDGGSVVDAVYTRQ